MKAQKIEGIWIVEFLDVHGMKQYTLNESLCKAVSMAFINRTTGLNQ